MAPPPNESLEARTERERAEHLAKKISNDIDDQIKIEKAELKKRRKNMIKVLILGQSESGEF